MSHRLLVGSVALLLSAAPGLTQEPPAEIQRLLERYEGPARQEWQKPTTVLRLLGLEPGQRVADLGTGTGYFLPRLALMVGDTGKVYGVDIDSKLLDFIKTRSDMNRDNIELILAEPDDPKLPQGELDVVLIVNTWHHIKGRVKYLRKVASGLNPWGRVVLIDFRPGELPVGPPPSEKLTPQEVIREFEKAGWTFGGESVALPYQYYLVFEPPPRR